MKYPTIGIVITSIALAFTVLNGCQADLSPNPGLGDPVPAPLNDPQISVLSSDLRPWLGFHPAIVVQNRRQPMQVEVPVRNLSNRQYLIEFRMLFYNEAGQELSPVMGWEMVPMDPKQTVRLKRSALSMDAMSYRLEVRWAR